MAKAAEETKKPAAKPGFGTKVANFFKGIGRFFMNMYHELKKVTWPTKKDMVNYSVVVVLFILIMIVVIGVFDTGAGALVSLIVK